MLYSQCPTPYTLHPTLYTLHPTPYTLLPAPYTLHSTPDTRYPTPDTRHPTLDTLHPTPHTPHSTPETRNLKSETRTLLFPTHKNCGYHLDPIFKDSFPIDGHTPMTSIDNLWIWMPPYPPCIAPISKNSSPPDLQSYTKRVSI